MHMNRVGSTVASTIQIMVRISCSINSELFSFKGCVMLLKFLEDGLMVVFIIGIADGVSKWFTIPFTMVVGLGLLMFGV